MAQVTTVPTPVERHGDYWLKRDDLCEIAGVRGGKVRTCNVIIRTGLSKGQRGVVTAGSRSSPQVNIVAHLAAMWGLPCRVHTPSGPLSPEVQQATSMGAVVVQHKPGYNSVITAHARADAATRGWIHVPFGMECVEAVEQTKAQVANLPWENIRRLVVPVGSGMTLAGILHGLITIGRPSTPVIGVTVGADPAKRLHKYAFAGWQSWVKLVRAAGDYHKPAATCMLGGVQLDPHYEAKVLPYLEPGDCFWIVGIRRTAQKPEEER